MVTLQQIRDALPAGYTVDRSIKDGGQGSVLRGQKNGKEVAVKLFGGNVDRRRLAHEIDVLRNHNCANLITIRDYFVIQILGSDVDVVVYDFVGGSDLRTAAAGQVRMSAAEILSVAVDASNAISALWQLRVVHRDIKPDNVMRDQSGRAILVDLGVAKHLDRTAVTIAGFNPGTPGYMSPEQAAGRKNLTIRSDVFSLGITLYEIAAATHPFLHMQAAIGTNQPRILRNVRPDLSKPLCDLIHLMMSPRLADRPTNLQDRLSRC
ncbi:MAG: serine/threonine-protein kinase [Planctomycetota bacterium]